MLSPENMGKLLLWKPVFYVSQKIAGKVNQGCNAMDMRGF